MNCSVCNEQKETLRAVNSKAAPGLRFYACKTCRDQGLEPRYLLILALRSNMPGTVREYIKTRKYIGRPILGEELV